ncbi:Unknown protein sequence [Pseudomonas syringae pv. syringae]|nr:Unknown protein sequence [Pseudomonas syringae pv. syringae]
MQMQMQMQMQMPRLNTKSIRYIHCQLLVDSVEKVGRGFQGRKVRA